MHGKISYGNANARDMLSLKASVSKLPELKNVLSNAKTSMLSGIYENLDELKDIYELIEKSVIEEPVSLLKRAERYFADILSSFASSSRQTLSGSLSIILWMHLLVVGE